ncbi:MAG: hypothetical protein ACRDNS_14250 [Trebonia sp.]
MRFTPLRQVGRRTRENRAAHLRDWQAILARAGRRCEGCGVRDASLQDAHLAGRPGSGACLGPWANAPELRAALCCADPRTGLLGCHEKIDRNLDPELRDRLRWAAARRLLARLHGRAVAFRRVNDDGTEAEPLDVIRGLVRELEVEGMEP